MFRNRYVMCFQNYILKKRLQYAYKINCIFEYVVD